MVRSEASLETPCFCNLALRPFMPLILKGFFGQGDEFLPLYFSRDLSSRYPAVRVILQWRRWSQISFANWTNFKFWVPPSLTGMSKLPCCPPGNEWLFASWTLFENVCIASIMGKGSKTFMWFFFSWADHITPVVILLHIPRPLLRYLSVLTPLQAVESMPDHCTVLSFVPTVSVCFLSFRSRQFCLNKKVFR